MENEKKITTQDRIKKFIAFKGLSTKRFEELAGLSNGYVNSVKHRLGERKLESVLNAFPELNRNWLMFGEGNMLKETKYNVSQEDKIKEMENRICELVADKKHLQETVQNLQFYIAKLLEKI